MKALKTFGDGAKAFLAVLLVLAIGFGGGYCYCRYKLEQNAEPFDNSKNFDLKLPGEVEKRIITKNEVEAKLIEIGQLATYSGEYTIEKSAENARYLGNNLRILGTTNSIAIDCTGVVKVGYNVSDIVPTVDNESQKIYIALPEPAVLDNYVIWDSVKYAETNNILNPIDFEQYRVLIQECEEDGLAKVEGEGIYKAAEENVKLVIRNFLSAFEDYEVIFL